MIVNATISNGDDSLHVHGRIRGKLKVEVCGGGTDTMATIKNQSGQQVELLIPRGVARLLAQKILAMDQKD